MKNLLEKFVEENSMVAGKVMNLLQGNGIISDNSVELSEVSDADFPTAKKFLVKFLPIWKRD